MAARNNLALAYYYMGQFEKSMETIEQVLDIDLVICTRCATWRSFISILATRRSRRADGLLCKTYPFHQDHVFKLATTMGILSEHEKAYRLFKRLLKTGEAGLRSVLVSLCGCSSQQYEAIDEADRQWRQADKFDPGARKSPGFTWSMLRNRVRTG